MPIKKWLKLFKNLSHLKEKWQELARLILRASTSISLNIAEGNGRFHKRDKVNFFYVSRGSIFECVPILHVLKSRNLINDDKYEELYSKLETLSKMISGLINSIKKSP